MSDRNPVDGVIPLESAPPDLSYPGVSPQLLARVSQLWSARGLDFHGVWRHSLRSLPGFRALPRVDGSATSAQVDLVFLFDQGVIWARAFHAATAAGHRHSVPGLSGAQWYGLAGVSARLIEQLSALRLLALTDLPMPAMQIARSISEDADMALVLLIRARLAENFAQCRTPDSASDFWRRHIAGGRAFRAISERLYSVGIDHSDDTDYAKWRRSVLTTLGAAVHSNALRTDTPGRRDGQILLNDDSLHFATFRLHELCAFAQLLKPELTDILAAAGIAALDDDGGARSLAPLAAPLSGILVNQIQSLASPAPARASGGPKRH
ncbi:hypothetical protein PVT71_28315 (plasmid) [Salipiger sp. H15]|uniref:hypothetical protein n=1 Tax=Alloyangia sp. H15 TaxID=3029062 RepID=UPI003364B664